MKNAAYFLSDGPPADFVQVPFGDLDALGAALGPGDAAAFLVETIPASLGFPLPPPGYHAAQPTRAPGAVEVLGYGEVSAALAHPAPGARSSVAAPAEARALSDDHLLRRRYDFVLPGRIAR